MLPRMSSPRVPVVPCVLLMLVLLLPATRAPAAEDTDGARDPLGIPRFPDSWIVTYQRDDTPQARVYVLGRVGKIRRDLRLEHEVRTPSTRELAIYEMPAGTPREEVIQH